MLPFQLILRLHGPQSREFVRTIFGPDAARWREIEKAFNDTQQQLSALGWQPAANTFVRQ